MLGFFNLVAVPLGLGLIGFVEPCSIGSSLLFIKYLEGKSTRRKVVETILFTLTRGVFIGTLGVVAVLLGSAFLGFQRAAWIALGAVYLAIGALMVMGRSDFLMASIGLPVWRLSGIGGSMGLGVFFGLNIPACAAPLLFALLGAAAAGGTSGATLASGFVSLGIFGLALSLPLVAAVLIPAARRLLDWLAALSGRFPVWAGLVLIALGLWSIGFALFVRIVPN